MDNMGNVDDFDFEPNNVDMEVTNQWVNEEAMEVEDKEQEEEAQGHAN
jgi:hypothetical protein